jgi:hypothetical protein
MDLSAFVETAKRLKNHVTQSAAVTWNWKLLTNLKAEISSKETLFSGNEYIYVNYNFITTSDCVILHTVSNYRLRFLYKLSRLITL